MKPPIRPTGYLAAALLVVTAAFWGAGPAIVAGFSQDQTGPTVGSPPVRPTQPRAITMEERADIFMARKNYGDAEDYYYRALKQSSFKNKEVWNKLGIAFQVDSKFHSARKAFTSAIHIDKNYAEAWNNIGTIYYMEKKYGRSVKFYEHAIELKGDNASFHMNLGTSYYHLKQFTEAVQEYRTALGIDPKILSLQSSVGTTVHASGEGAEFYFYMAKAFASIGDADDAVRYLRHALEDGFSDVKRVDQDTDFQKISQYPAFVELMQNPPVAIKN
jgi:tetratricopeptide (TPR) repeat protein